MPLEIQKKMLYNIGTAIILEGIILKMKAVITVTGRDSVGIISLVSTECAASNANILEISQTVLSEYFAMIMLVDVENLKIPFIEFADRLTELGRARNLDIHVMHEDIFNSMHRI